MSAYLRVLPPTGPVNYRLISLRSQRVFLPHFPLVGIHGRMSGSLVVPSFISPQIVLNVLGTGFRSLSVSLTWRVSMEEGLRRREGGGGPVPGGA